MRAVDLLAERAYILGRERDLTESEQTKFYIKGLPYDLYQRLQDSLAPVIKMPGKAFGKKGAASMEDSMVEMQPGARQRLEFDILSAGLVKVENLLGPEGEMHYRSDMNDAQRKDWFARWLPPDVRTELVNAITEGSRVSEEDEKN